MARTIPVLRHSTKPPIEHGQRRVYLIMKNDCELVETYFTENRQSYWNDRDRTMNEINYRIHHGKWTLGNDWEESVLKAMNKDEGRLKFHHIIALQLLGIGVACIIAVVIFYDFIAPFLYSLFS